MPIAILPARLANQIAAGEVVERPASVVKELVENSIDAGATRIQIDIEKGGAKRIKITDNGCGIDKDELTLALSRHATSKIKCLDDLEAIGSLGFRGEALASISSVSRLTLTSKPARQDAAWQAQAEGRDMAVTIQPAAHPDGTSIDVTDLFFNTPARRKFLRTEKTEFSYIEEVIKRIALANFDITFVLNHNQKLVKNFRAVKQQSQYLNRIASVCGQAFVDNAIAIDCQHDDIHLTGWIAKPSFTRKQNDLSYSYVNGRMMRDKLINHAIRQAYGEFVANDEYPAFVLFLTLDFKEVDVNVHPAKHEVRFHQGRYVHDFIYSVCHKALHSSYNGSVSQGGLLSVHPADGEEGSHQYNHEDITVINNQDKTSYIKPLQQTDDQVREYSQSYQRSASAQSHRSPSFNAYSGNNVTKLAADNYQRLMTPAHSSSYDNEHSAENPQPRADIKPLSLLYVHQEMFAVYHDNNQLNLCELKPLEILLLNVKIAGMWSTGLTSQPLLLPIKLKADSAQIDVLVHFEKLLINSGIVVSLTSGYAQIRQFPAILRAQDVASSFEKILLKLSKLKKETELDVSQWQLFLAELAATECFNLSTAKQLWQTLQQMAPEQLIQHLSLNSVAVDLTSLIKHLPVVDNIKDEL